jgi:hypothetical protein
MAPSSSTAGPLLLRRHGWFRRDPGRVVHRAHDILLSIKSTIMAPICGVGANALEEAAPRFEVNHEESEEGR